MNRTVKGFRRIALLAAILAVTCISALSQISVFQPPAYSASGTEVFTGDFNGDGNADLLDCTGNLQLGNGDGTFTAGTAVSGGAVAIGDFNGDGILDILQQGDLTLMVLIGNGDGTFQAALNTASGATLTHIVTADLNGDGKADVLGVSNNITLLVYLNKGSGTFSPGAVYSLGGASTIIPGDFTGDKIPDVAVIGAGNNFDEVLLLVNNGDGSLQTAITSPSTTHSGPALAGDFNGDGKLDIALGCFTCAPLTLGGTLLLGNGDGTFQAGTTIPVLIGSNMISTDLNGDGKLDLVITGFTTGVFLGNGDGTFTQGNGYNLGPAVGLVAADFNGDGNQDIASTGDILLGNGDGTLQGQPAIITAAATAGAVTGDFDGNGTMDVAEIDQTGDSVYTFSNDGQGNLALTGTYTTLVPSSAIIVTDLNADGILDLVVTGFSTSTGNWSYSIMRGKGDGTFFSPAYNKQSTGSPNAMIVADFNNDLKSDLAITAVGDSVAVLPGLGNGSFLTGQLFPDGSATSLAAADFNGDGFLDIAAAGPNGLAILLGNGDSSFQAASFPSTTALQAVFAGDLNKDGKPDLVVNSNGQNQVFLGNGDGTFAAQSAFGSGPAISALSDLNLDGNLDIVATDNSGTGAVEAVYMGNGDGTFATATTLYSFPSTGLLQTFLNAVDLNADTKPDLLIGTATGFSTVLINTTAVTVTGTITPSSLSFVPQLVGSSSSSVAVDITNTSGAASLLVSSISFSGSNASDFSQTNNCSTLPAGGTCTINVVFTPAATGARSASLAIATNLTAGSPTTITLAGTGIASGLGLTVATGSPSSSTITAGSSATFTMSIGGAGTGGTATLSCTAPDGSNIICSVPATMDVSATTPATFSASFSTMARTSGKALPLGGSVLLLGTALMGIAYLPRRRAIHGKTMRRGVLPLIFLLVWLVGCGSSGSSSGGGGGGQTGTPAGTYSVMVTATMGSTTQTVPLMLIVQ